MFTIVCYWTHCAFWQASLHDIIHKNMDKIKKPRSGNAENLY